MVNFFFKQIYKYKVYIKYVISGGTAAGIDLIILYILTDIFNIWYLLSACLAFVVAYFVSFYLQKFWTFRDNSRERIVKQMSLYLIVGVSNLGINAGGMYILVDKLGIMYILAQVIMGGIIAIGSFLIYKFVIFSARGGYDFGGKKQKVIKHESR